MELIFSLINYFNLFNFCFLGARFANYQVKLGLIMILRNYKVEVCEKTMIPYQFDPNLFLLGPKGGIYLKITKVES